MRPGNSRDFEVVGPQNPALNLQLVAHIGIVAGRRIVKGQRGERREQHFQSALPALAVAVFLRAMPQLGLDHGTQKDACDWLRPDPGFEVAAGLFSSEIQRLVSGRKAITTPFAARFHPAAAARIGQGQTPR